MKPYNPGRHSTYQERVLAQLRKYYPDAVSSLPASTWEIMEKFWNLDLSDMDSLMADRYSDFGPAPRLPSDMLRSILLSVEFKVTSLFSQEQSRKLDKARITALFSFLLFSYPPYRE